MPRNWFSFALGRYFAPLRLYVELLEALGYKNVNPEAMLGSRPLPAAPFEGSKCALKVVLRHLDAQKSVQFRSYGYLGGSWGQNQINFRCVPVFSFSALPLQVM